MAPDESRARRRRRVGAASIAVAALTGTFVAANAASAATAATAATVTFGGMQPAWATASADRGQVAPGTAVTSTIYLAGRDQVGMEAYAEAVSTPGNALYHKYLSTSQFQARFGTTAAQLSAVEKWVRSSGLKVVSANSHEIQVSGTAAQTESIYGLSLHNYSVKGRTYRAPASSSAHLPSGVAADVLSVGSLSTLPVLMAPAGVISTNAVTEKLTGTKPTKGVSRDGAVYVGSSICSAYYGQLIDTTAPTQGGKENPYSLCGYTPQQFRSAYGVTGVGGKGVTVAIVDAYGSSDILSDANTYAKYMGDPAFKPGQFLDTETPADFYDDADCGGPDAWAPEEHIDVEAVHAMAPQAKVHYYGGNSCQNPDLLAPIQQIVDTHSADIVTDSWGSVVFSSTGNLTSADKDAYDQALKQGAIEGIEFNFSTGDCGAEDPDTGCGTSDTSTVPQADWPDSDPWVTAVGGTSTAIGKHGDVEWNVPWGTNVYLQPAASGSPWTFWEWAFGGGGGTSAIFAQPWYQRGTVSHTLATTLPDGSRTSSAMRTVPDVSMDADPFTGFQTGMTMTLDDGSTVVGIQPYGGTSLASPLFAGLQADVMQLQHGQPVGFANPALYARYGSPVYSDVTGNGPGAKAYNDIPTADGTGTDYSVGFGDDQLLKATRGYDEATGIGAPNPLYLWSHLIW